MNDTKEGFAARWSRMKREREGAEVAVENPEPPEEAPAEDSGPPDDELTDAELLEKYALPDPDGMKAGDNFAAFMKAAVPERLRRRALRALWVSNPVLANLDELLDYGDDFTDAATVVENMSTIYQVGKGAAWKFREEQERLAALLEEEKSAAPPANADPIPDETVADPAPIEAAAADDPLAPAPEIDVEVEVAAAESEAAAAQRYRPRPMQFSFDGD